MAGRALDVACIQRVVNTCWLSKSLGQLPESVQQRDERDADTQGERKRRVNKVCVCVCVCVCACMCVHVCAF